jgi:ribose transport system permease protein
MAKTLEQKQQSWLAEKLSSQTFWVFIAVVLACLYLSFATDSFATTKIYNITRNVTFVAIISSAHARDYHCY